MGFEIGNLILKSRVFLAPMLEPNDVAFRLLCKRAGAGLTWTGMVSPLSTPLDKGQTGRVKKLDLDDRPVLQLFGNSVRGIKSFMKKYDSKVAGWDFNLGCPSKLARRLEHGVFMHEDLEMIERILKTMRSMTERPLMVKLRKSARAIEIARLAERVGFDAVAIHARTFEQGYSGEVDYDFALRLKKGVSVPVIFSGDVVLRNVNKILKDFDFVMVGRGAIGNPGIFSGKKIGFEEYLELARKYGLAFRQVKFQAMNWTKGMKNACRIREELVFVKSVEEIRILMGKNK